SRLIPASWKSVRSSSAGLNRWVSLSSRSLHSRCLAPGIAPARLLVCLSVPQNSPSDLASTICRFCFLRDSSNDCFVANRFETAWVTKSVSVGDGGLSVWTGKASFVQDAQPPLSKRTSFTPQYRRIHQMRAASLLMLSSYTTILEFLPTPNSAIRWLQPFASLPSPKALDHVA